MPLEKIMPRLLVIDDEPGICLALSLLLQDEYEVHTAKSAEDALRQLDHPFAIVLLDLRLPGVDGYELLDNVRAKARATPIIILTALGDPRTCKEVRQHGAAALLEKPFCRYELLAAIQDTLSR